MMMTNSEPYMNFKGYMYVTSMIFNENQENDIWGDFPNWTYLNKHSQHFEMTIEKLTLSKGSFEGIAGSSIQLQSQWTHSFLINPRADDGSKPILFVGGMFLKTMIFSFLLEVLKPWVTVMVLRQRRTKMVTLPFWIRTWENSSLVTRTASTFVPKKMMLSALFVRTPMILTVSISLVLPKETLMVLKTVNSISQKGSLQGFIKKIHFFLADGESSEVPKMPF
jgi:hypothetical protein